MQLIIVLIVQAAVLGWMAARLKELQNGKDDTPK